MARGQQKVQSQQKAAEKAAKQKKQQGEHHVAECNNTPSFIPLFSPLTFVLWWWIFLSLFLGHSATTQKAAAQKALVFACTVCKSQMPDPKTYKQHFENKHPKSELPAELKDVA